MSLFVGSSESYDTDAWEAYNLKKENAKLRELAKEMWSVMWACAEERCTHRENGCYRVSGNCTAPKGHGECWFKQRMRELGAEVDG